MQERVEVRGFLHEFFELQATAAKNVDITSAVFYYLFSEVKDMVPVLKLLMPSEEFVSFSLAHTVRIVVLYRRDRSNLVLIF